MPPAILSSSVLTLPILDALLLRSSDPSDRVPLLSAKLALLENSPAPADPLAVLRVRVELARAYAGCAPPDLHAAESEAGVVDAACRRLGKRRQADEQALRDLRREALAVLGEVEEALGRIVRAKRTRETLERLKR
ncbi:hypothetical protein Q5752_002286 [Cryptotrichosporon argae]